MTDPTTTTLALRLDHVRFAYPGSAAVIDIKAFEMARSERVFLKGESGSGKSTLLALVAGILQPQAGRISVLGTELSALSGARRDAFRAEQLGVIFQMFNLLPYLSVGENITLPCRFSRRRADALGRHAAELDTEARRLLSRLELDPDVYWTTRPTALSVGQQQRVAAARALIGQPGLILADEPTSALDTGRRNAFINLLQDECARSGSALLFVSHDETLARHFDRSIDLSALNTATEAT